MAHITLQQLTTVLQRIVSWVTSKFAAKNTVSGKLDYADMPVVVLASMGHELDGTDNDIPVSVGGTFFLPAGGGTAPRIMYRPDSGNPVKISDPVSGVIYCNAYTNLLYRWDTAQAKMVSVGGTSGGSTDVSGKADLLTGTNMLTPSQWPKTVLRNVTDAILDDLSSGDVYYDSGNLYLYKGENQNPVDLGTPSSKIIYFCLADGKMYRWVGNSFQPVLSAVATSGSYNDLSNKPDLSKYPIRWFFNGQNQMEQAIEDEDLNYGDLAYDYDSESLYYFHKEELEWVKIALDSEVVKSISVNGGTAQTPTQGNVNIVVNGESTIDPATAMPKMDGTATAGTSAKYAREDHVHPHDASKQDTLTFDDVPTAGSNKPVKSGGIKQSIDEKADIDDVYSKSAADAKFATKTELNNVSVATVPSNQVAVITNLDGADEQDHPNAVLHADEGRKLKEALLNHLVPLLRKAAYSVTGANDYIDNFVASLNSQPVVETGKILRVLNIALSSGYIDNNGVAQQQADNYYYDELIEAVAFALLDTSAEPATVTSSRIAEYGANGAFLGCRSVNKAQIAGSKNPTKIKAGFVASAKPAYIAYFVKASSILTIAGKTLDNDGVEQVFSESGFTRNVSDYIDISSNKGFLLWTLQVNAISAICCFYDSNHTFISRNAYIGTGTFDANIDNYKKVAIPSNAAYVRFGGDPSVTNTFLYAL